MWALHPCSTSTAVSCGSFVCLQLEDSNSLKCICTPISWVSVQPPRGEGTSVLRLSISISPSWLHHLQQKLSPSHECVQQRSPGRTPRSISISIRILILIISIINMNNRCGWQGPTISRWFLQIRCQITLAVYQGSWSWMAHSSPSESSCIHSCVTSQSQVFHPCYIFVQPRRISELFGFSPSEGLNDQGIPGSPVSH